MFFNLNYYMKRVFAMNLFLLFFIEAFSQSNTFPPNGNAGIGSIDPLNGLHLFNLNNFSGGSLRLGHSGSHDAVLSFGWNGFDQDAFKISYIPSSKPI